MGSRRPSHRSVVHSRRLEADLGSRHGIREVPPAYAQRRRTFVGMVTDDPLSKIELKAFHCEIQNDHAAMQNEEAGFKDIEPVRKIDQAMVQRNYEQVKQDVQEIIQSEIENLLSDPAKAYLVVKK